MKHAPYTPNNLVSASTKQKVEYQKTCHLQALFPLNMELLETTLYKAKFRE